MRKIFLILTIISLFTGCSSDKSVAPITYADIKLSVQERYVNCLSNFSDIKNSKDVEKYCKCVWNYESEYGSLEYNSKEAEQQVNDNIVKCMNPTIEAYFDKKAQEKYNEKVGEAKEKIYEECLVRIKSNLDDYNKENYFNQIKITFDMMATWKESCKCEAGYLTSNYIKRYPKNGFKSKMEEDVFESKLQADAVKKCH